MEKQDEKPTFTYDYYVLDVITATSQVTFA